LLLEGSSAILTIMGWSFFGSYASARLKLRRACTASRMHVFMASSCAPTLPHAPEKHQTQASISTSHSYKEKNAPRFRDGPKTQNADFRGFDSAISTGKGSAVQPSAS